MNVLVSACLLGENCKYSQGNNYCESVASLTALYGQPVSLIPVCPEVAGGLSTPRPPAEIRGGRVRNRDGQDVTDAFERGAAVALETARVHGCKYAILKERSPSCGRGVIYDGTFTNTLTEGSGLTARLLSEHGIQILGESEICCQRYEIL